MRARQKRVVNKYSNRLFQSWTSMSQDIKSHMEQYIQQERILLDQISQLKRQGNIGTEIGKAVVSEGAAAVVANLFESSLAGRLGRKLAKSALDQQQKNQFLIQERNIENQHNSLVQKARDFVSSVSVKRKNLQEANSHELIRRLDRAQEFLRAETRIRRTITTLKDIASKQLIYNRDNRFLAIFGNFLYVYHAPQREKASSRD